METGPVVGRRLDGSLDWSLVDAAAGGSGGGLGRVELIADAAVDAKALDVLAVAIVPAQVGDPAGADELLGETNTILAVGADAGRGEIRDRLKARNRLGERGGHVSLEFMPDARGGKRLQDRSVGADGRPDPPAGAAERALDILNDADAGRDRGGARCGDRVDFGDRVDEPDRRLDEPGCSTARSGTRRTC